MNPAVVGSLLVGITIGFMGQRSRMCFIAGMRDSFIVRDDALLLGAASFFASATVTVWIIRLAGPIAVAFDSQVTFEVSSYPPFSVVVGDPYLYLAIGAAVLLGFFSTLAGGCPMRMHVLAAQGRLEACVYLIGLAAGVVVYLTWLGPAIESAF